MSPARVLQPTEQDQQLKTLSTALDALLVTAYQLSLRERELQRRVQSAHDEVRSSTLTSASSLRLRG